MVRLFAWLVSWLPQSWQPRRIIILAQRAGEWRTVREAHLRQHPACAACGRTKNLIVHHVIPVSFAPEKELDPENLLTLCETPCHIVFGHFFNYRCYNKHVRKMAADYAKALQNKKCLKRTEQP